MKRDQIEAKLLDQGGLSANEWFALNPGFKHEAFPRSNAKHQNQASTKHEVSFCVIKYLSTNVSLEKKPSFYSSFHYYFM